MVIHVLHTMAVLMFLTTALQAWRTYKQWNAYQRGEVTRGQAVNLITTTLLMAVATFGLFVLGRLVG